MKKLLLFVGTVFLFACATYEPTATTEKYQQKLNTWIGASENQLLLQWGVPQSSYTNGDTKFLQYHYDSSYTSPSTYETNYNPITHNTEIYETGRYTLNFWCDTTFEVRNGIVRQWHIKGNSCVSE